MPDIKKIVLTGGPCAGKTTALVKITEYFLYVIFSPVFSNRILCRYFPVLL